MLRILSLALLLSFSSSAMAVFKCESNGKFIYSDQPCPSGKSTTLKNNSTGFASTSDGAKAKKKLDQEKMELARLQKERHQREAKEEKEYKSSAKSAAAMKKKCAVLEQHKRWADEDLASATGMAASKAKTKARRAAEKYLEACKAK